MKTPIIFALVILLSLWVIRGNLTRGHNWGGDFASYIMQAESVASGAPRSFVEANRFTIEQSSKPIGAIAYPWGFPVLLSPVYALFGLDPIALKWVGISSFLLFLVSLWYAFRKTHSTLGFLCLVTLFALNPALTSFPNEILSDLPFLLMSTFCVALIQKKALNRREYSRPLDMALIGVVITVASLIRTNGILLLVTLAITQLISRFRSDSSDERPSPLSQDDSVSSTTRYAQFIPYMVFIFSVIVWDMIFPDGGKSHGVFLKNLTFDMLAGNFSYYIELPSLFFRSVPHYHLIYGATIPLAVFGAVRRYRTDYPAIIYIALTLCLYTCWPIRQSLRFLFPILPFYLSFVFSALEHYCEETSSGGSLIFRRAICYIPVLFMIVCFFGSSISREDKEDVTHGPFSPKARELFTYIEKHTKPDDVIVFFKPRVMRLMTGRKSLMISNVEYMLRGDYLCINLREKTYDQPPAAAIKYLRDQGIAKLVYANDDFHLYHLSKTKVSL